MGGSMSSVIITGDTSGAITLAAPSVAGTNTITLPANTGTVITTASSGQSIPKPALPTGSVLQVVSANRSGEAATTSSSFVDSGLSVSITPTSSTSKIFVMYTGSAGTSATQEAYLTLLRGSTNLGNGTQGLMRLWFNGSSSYHFGGMSMSYLDSPATTSSTTYKVQYRSDGTNYVYISGGNSTDTLTAWEIAA